MFKDTISVELDKYINNHLKIGEITFETNNENIF